MNEQVYNKDINFKNILLYVIPTMIMVLIQASYSMIDGIFISNIIGDDALSALTLISPLFNFFIALGAMFSSGGNAIIMKKMGEKKEKEAREDFSMLILITTFIGIIITIFMMFFYDNIVYLFGANEVVTTYSNQYLFAYSFFIIPQVLFSSLQIYTLASGKSKLAMFSAIFGGIFNIVFDFLLIKVFNLGMFGASISSGLGMLIPCLILLKGFIGKKQSIHFILPKFRLNTLTKTISNGVSEFATNFVSGIVMLLFNARMLHYAGENGISASTITFYVFGFMSALYTGYMFGIAPMLSYFYGSNEKDKLKKLKNISLVFIIFVSILSTICSITFSKQLVSIFTSESSKVFELAYNGNKLFSIALLFVGINTFSSMLFTSLSNGKISAIISFCRTFIFLIATIFILPLIFNINGLWLSVPVSEILALIMSIYFIKKYSKKYGY
ncbi:MATE family efflux transporter [uncultured Tyzzerella sp.]|uniref:MATE family efflux transporter n=1 Tax=uncultured Tyzzerella sp. TaxID=2321398 RepID=UPI002943947D|nr:MATE family efflux transporter [uncultured Tyzzerella sp.]